MLIFPPAVTLQCAETKAQVAKLVAQKIDKKFVYSDLLNEMKLAPAASTLSLQSLIGKPIHATTMVSADHLTSLVWIVGSKDKSRVIIIGIWGASEVFLVTSTSRIYPKSFNYAEYPVFLPLDRGRVLYWGLGSRECSILKVSEVQGPTFSGYDLNAFPLPEFHDFDALDATMKVQIRPYSFSRTGLDDSSDIRLVQGDRKLVVKNGYSYLWEH